MENEDVTFGGLLMPCRRPFPASIISHLSKIDLPLLFLVTFVCILLLTPRVGTGADYKGAAAASGTAVAEDRYGPTMRMSYSKEKFVKNPIASFAYFIPLIATTRVDSISSVNNEQHISIISHTITADAKSFHLTCEFELSGMGFHMNTFDPAEMLAAYADELKKRKTMTNMLDYIRFEGDGFGVIEVKGTIVGSTRIVTEVDIRFNAEGHKSPVTIGLYDIKPQEGAYKYENRTNEVVARVNTLSFKRTKGTPHLGIKVASIHAKGGSAGFYSGLKGQIVNFFITPPRVDQLGNATMLAFGNALVQKKAAFTFPKAKNLKESRIVAIDHIKNKMQ
jgi:hypothetical protein